MATHSITLAWRIPWREEPGRLQSMGLQRVWHNWATSLHSDYIEHPFMYLLAICIISFGEMSIAPFARYFTSLSFCCWIVRVLCMFIIWNPYQKMIWKYSILCLVFSHSCPLMLKSFCLGEAQLMCFFSDVISENALLIPSYEDFLCFLQKFYCFSSYFWVFDPF